MADDRRRSSSAVTLPAVDLAQGLANSDVSFRLLVEGVTDYAIFMVDPQGHVATWNQGAEMIKGYSAKEIIGRPTAVFYTPEDRAAGRPRALLDRAENEGRVEDQGLRVRKDGSQFWADVTLTALRDPDGALRGFAKVTRDLTERRRADDERRRSEERFRALVEQVEDYAIFMLDASGHIATWNVGAQRMKGYRAHEVIGKHFSIFYPADEVRAGKCEHELEVAKNIGRFEDEGFRLRKDGSQLWVNVIITALRGDDGELLGFTKVTRDLSERKLAEEERLRLAHAQEAIRLRDEFLAIASHELKTPLTALRLQLQSLEQRADQLDATTARKIARASHSSTRLSHLVESLLDVSRIATGRLTLHVERFDLYGAVAQLLEGMAVASERANAPIALSGEQAIEGQWDRTRIEQVVTNLLANALKYGAGAAIDVTLTREGDVAVIAVRDRGPGIPANDLERIFGRYERAASMLHYGGLGLGLYVAEQIVLAHAGSIAAENLEQGGALFTVRLPLTQGQA